MSVLYTPMGGVVKSSCIGTGDMGRVAAGGVVRVSLDLMRARKACLWWGSCGSGLGGNGHAGVEWKGWS